MLKLRWLGHAAWSISSGDTVVIIDPFLTDNPKAAIKASDIKKADFVIVTHDHYDHLGDAVDIAYRTGAKFISIFETANLAQKDGDDPSRVVGMNIGSLADLGKIKVGLTPAVHSGNQCGVIVKIGGKTIYHAGDTALFSDMKLIKEQYHPDIAMLPIGGFFTMGPKEAAKAAEWIGAKLVFPMHYNTYPPIAQDPKVLAKGVKRGIKVVVLNPGDTYEVK